MGGARLHAPLATIGLIGMLLAAIVGAAMSEAAPSDAGVETPSAKFQAMGGPWARPQAPELLCLANAIYFEARGEPGLGQLAVGRVILNRVQARGFPDTICEVVFQNAERLNACQFSFACDGTVKPVSDAKAWNEAMRRAIELATCEIGCPGTASGRSALWTSTHFHADYVSPWWAAKLTRTSTVGRHIFYYEHRA